jgi:hypothetical protein
MAETVGRGASGDSDERIEDDLGDESTVIPFIYSITSYGADYPVDGVVRRIKDGDIAIPDFQRSYVWNINEASRFVESLLLGLPVPGIFLSREQDTNKLLVIDGQQRLRTLQYFYDGIFEPTKRAFSLQEVQPSFKGKRYQSLQPEDRRRLDDSILHATVVKQDEPSDDDSSVYQIFERLNTGGRQLSPQEIRACIFHGEFSLLLRQLNENRFWRKIYGRASPRMRDQELILRFLALYFDLNDYSRPMKEFLNNFMGKHRHPSAQEMQEMASAFEPAVKTIFDALESNAFKPTRALNAAVFDSVTIGVARGIANGLQINPDQLREQYSALLNDEQFGRATYRATADEDSVKTRIKLAETYFGSNA